MFLFTIKNGYRFVQAWVKNPIYVECFGNQFRRSIEFMNAGAKRARVKPSNFESRMVDIYHPCLERGMVLLLDLPYYIHNIYILIRLGFSFLGHQTGSCGCASNTQTRLRS